MKEPAAIQQPMLLWNIALDAPWRINVAFQESLGGDLGRLKERSLLEWIHSEDRGAFQSLLLGEISRLDARFQAQDGRWVSLCCRVRGEGDEAFLLAQGHGASSDVSQSTNANGPAVKPGLKATRERMALIVEHKNPGLRCSILLIDSEGKRIVGGAGPSLPAAYNQCVEGLAIGPAVGSCGTASYWNIQVIVEDIHRDPLWANLRDAAKLAGVGSCWSQPSTSTDGRVLGAMALYSPTALAPKEHQLAGLEIAARMVGLAVERERLDVQLRSAAKMEALGVLAGGIAHDFNNMLAIILGNAELAKSKLDSHGRLDSHLDEIITASKNSTELCNQMLAYAGRGASVVEDLECNALVREIGGLMRVALSKKAKLTLELDKQALGTRADRSQIKQVLLNMITNASESLGGQEGEITLRSGLMQAAGPNAPGQDGKHRLPAGEYIYLSIEDTGPGMSPELQAQIFDPFFTTKATGRGLGLAAVQGIVHRHQGEILLDSAPGNGSRFTIYLPHVAALRETNATSPPVAPPRGHARILVVDDEPQVRVVLAELLRSGGYSVLEASGGEQALQAFRKDPDGFEMVLLDLNMPGMGGDQVFDELKAIRPNVRVILSSGFTEQQILDRFRGRGLTGVIQKPASMEALLAKVGEALESQPTVGQKP